MRAPAAPRQTRRILLTAFAALVVAALFAIALLQGSGGATAPPTAVLVAKETIAAGTVIRPEQLGTLQVAADEATMGATFLPTAEQAQVVGRVAGVTIPAGSALAPAHLAVPGTQALGPGQQALTIAVDEATAVGGKIAPGDTVRVYVTQSEGEQRGQTRVVLPRVRVYAVSRERGTTVSGGVIGGGGTTGGGGAGAAPTGPLTAITLALGDGEAQALAGAKWDGHLDVALLPQP